MAFTKITSDGIGDNAVTSDKIASGAITVADIPDGEISAAKLHTTAISDKLGFTPVNPASINNVENKSSATIRSEITLSNVTTALGYTPVNKAGDTLTKPLKHSSYNDITNTNLNNLNVGGIYMGYNLNGANNGPVGSGWAVVEVMTNGSDQVRQKYNEAQYDGGRVYERWSSNGGSTWNSWTIFTKGGKSPAVIGLNAGGDTTTWYNVAPFTYNHVKYYISTHENNYHQFWEITCSSNGSISWMKAPDAGHTHSSDMTFRISGGYLQCKNVSYTTGRQVFVYSIEST